LASPPPHFRELSRRDPAVVPLPLFPDFDDIIAVEDFESMTVEEVRAGLGAVTTKSAVPFVLARIPNPDAPAYLLDANMSARVSLSGRPPPLPKARRLRVDNGSDDAEYIDRITGMSTGTEGIGSTDYGIPSMKLVHDSTAHNYEAAATARRRALLERAQLSTFVEHAVHTTVGGGTESHQYRG
jgi:hypothetical protein